jgi:hypothetical protein
MEPSGFSSKNISPAFTVEGYETSPLICFYKGNAYREMFKLRAIIFIIMIECKFHSRREVLM